MDIYVLRHGQTIVNVLKVTYDTENNSTPLTQIGREQIRAASIKLRNIPFQVLFSSPHMRALETAHIVNEQHQLPITVEENGLAERLTGVASMPSEEFYRALSEQGLWSAKMGDGESWDEEKKRVHAFLDRLVTLPYACVLLVTHMEIMQIMEGYFKKLSNDEMFEKKFGNGEFVKYTV